MVDPDEATGCGDDALPGTAEQWRAAIKQPKPALVEQWAVELARDWDNECRRCSEYEGEWQVDFANAIETAFAEREAAKDAEIAKATAWAVERHKCADEYAATITDLRAQVAELVKEKTSYDKAINLAYRVGYLQGKKDSGKVTTLPGGLLETVGAEIPPGCNCSSVCMAPTMMGRQMPCRRHPESLAKHRSAS